MADKFIRFTEKIDKLCGIFAAGCLLLSIVLSFGKSKTSALNKFFFLSIAF